MAKYEIIPNMLSDMDLLERGMITEEIFNELRNVCPSCGVLVGNNEKMTDRRCMNKYCYGHMKHLANDMIKHIGGLKGVGPETCESLLRDYNCESHFELIPKLYKDKPRVYLEDIGEIAGVPGYRSKWAELLKGYVSFEDFFNNFPPYNLQPYRDMLVKAESYFDVKPPLASDELVIVITGNVSGMTKKQYVDGLNALGGKYLKITHSTNFIQTANYCVTDQPGSNTHKIVSSRENRIPIVDSTTFAKIYKMLISEIENKNKG